jgi:hypothetical protein
MKWKIMRLTNNIADFYRKWQLAIILVGFWACCMTVIAVEASAERKAAELQITLDYAVETKV